MEEGETYTHFVEPGDVVLPNRRLTKDEPSGTPVTQTFSGTLALGAENHHGPFAVVAGTTFQAAMIALADNPLSGRLDEDHSPPGRPFRFRVVLSSFIVVYEPWELGIRVARILHGARFLLAELERDPGDEE